MESLLLKLVNRSITASWLVLAVLLLRLVFRKAPKWVSCLLWGLIALRLVCPVSIASALSLLPAAEPLPRDILYAQTPEIHSGVGIIDDFVNPALSHSLSPAPGASVNPLQVWAFVLSWIWAAGAAAMLLYALAGYLLLRRRVATATLLRENIKQSERAASPFVLGFFRPVIYLPYRVAEEDIGYVIAHEKAHIRRKDHWWKPIGFVLLAVYWFNPLLWAAYVLLCRDIEAACDEKVIREMGKEERRAYSAALLRCSVRHRVLAACPLAFGEIDVKGRIQGIMNYKKPAPWVVLPAAAATMIAAVCFLTVPKTDARSSSLIASTGPAATVSEGREAIVSEGREAIVSDGPAATVSEGREAIVSDGPAAAVSDGTDAPSPDASTVLTPPINTADAAFLSSFGCSDRNCTDASHYHDCPTGCTKTSHRHGGQTVKSASRKHHGAGHHEDAHH